MPSQHKNMTGSSTPTDTPPNSPLLETSHQVGYQHALKLMDLLEDAAGPTTRAKEILPMEDIQKLMGLLKVAQEEGSKSSNLSFKEVDEIWDSSISQYKITESSKQVLDEDGCAFITRRRFDKKSEKQTYFIDIKSIELQEVVRVVLRDVRGLSLKENKPTIKRNVLYHFLNELEAYREAAESSTSKTPASEKQLALLIGHIKAAYASTIGSVIPLLESHEITFDLLWALFKPNDIVYGKCLGSDMPRCITFDLGEVRTLEDDTEYFHIEGRYWDYNGKFGESKTVLGIFKYSGAKTINSLDAYPLSYHEKPYEEKKKLISWGKQFISLTDTHHYQYQGTAFYMEKGRIVKVFVDGRIMVDPKFFWEMNPNYVKPRVDKLRQHQSPIPATIWFSLDPTDDNRIKVNCAELELSEDNLLLCSPTVLGYSLGERKWLEFAIENISDIEWDPEPFQQLVIPDDRKELILALADSHMNQGYSPSFDDFVAGKGRGLIMLLHGPPGVGKTLTAEGLAQHLRKPLFTVSTADLSIDPKLLEEKLSRIFRQAEHWNAILLLDEADVFMRERSLNHTDTHITTFLCTMEYFQGVMLLTTNRLSDFDLAMRSRVDLALSYPPLDFKTRRMIWVSFQQKVAKQGVMLNSNELDKLAEQKLDGRQIKSTFKLAYALACKRRGPVLYSDIELVLKLGEEFNQNFRGYGSVDALSSYT